MSRIIITYRLSDLVDFHTTVRNEENGFFNAEIPQIITVSETHLAFEKGGKVAFVHVNMRCHVLQADAVIVIFFYVGLCLINDAFFLIGQRMQYRLNQVI